MSPSDVGVFVHMCVCGGGGGEGEGCASIWFSLSGTSYLKSM